MLTFKKITAHLLIMVLILTCFSSCAEFITVGNGNETTHTHPNPLNGGISLDPILPDGGNGGSTVKKEAVRISETNPEAALTCTRTGYKVISVELCEGSATCADGATVVYGCIGCEHTYTMLVYDHVILKESFEFSALGGCKYHDAYVSLERCACDEVHDLEAAFLGYDEYNSETVNSITEKCSCKRCDFSIVYKNYYGRPDAECRVVGEQLISVFYGDEEIVSGFGKTTLAEKTIHSYVERVSLAPGSKSCTEGTVIVEKVCENCGDSKMIDQLSNYPYHTGAKIYIEYPGDGACIDHFINHAMPNKGLFEPSVFYYTEGCACSEDNCEIGIPGSMEWRAVDETHSEYYCNDCQTVLEYEVCNGEWVGYVLRVGDKVVFESK